VHVSIRGAREHNLKGIDVEFGDGLTVVTGVSGSGKTSLVFDTLYHEARRRFLEAFSRDIGGPGLSPARVDAVTGLGPAVAVGQNLLNRNPNSTLATASGLHPFLRLLYARFGERHCPRCGLGLSVLTEDEIVERLVVTSAACTAQGRTATVCVPLVQGVQGSHRTLLELLSAELGMDVLLVDGRPWHHTRHLDPAKAHSVEIEAARLDRELDSREARELVQRAAELGAHALVARCGGQERTFSRVPACAACGTWFGDLEPVHFKSVCPHCRGEGCVRCDGTGLYPEAAAVRWEGLRLPELLALSVDQARERFASAQLPTTAARLCSEIERRLEALGRVGLGYVSLDRSSPTLSRGEAQRVRLAVALTSRLEDLVHVLDEPTIGQHPADVARLLPAFRDLGGPVIYIEHDRGAAAVADWAVDLGPGAGSEGGNVLLAGTPAHLWEADTPTGRHFSLRERVHVPAPRPAPDQFLTVLGANLRNLWGIDVSIPLNRLTVITGVSGSGKSTLVEDVLTASLAEKRPIGCRAIEGPALQPVLVDQSPIGRNPRSNPATYTKLADIVRDYFAAATGLSSSHFSFNRPEGACPTCKGLGAVEVEMRYLPSTWIPCADCEGQRFSDAVLAARAPFGDRRPRGEVGLSIAEFYDLSVAEAIPLLLGRRVLPPESRRAARRILEALRDVGLGYLRLGQPSPTLSGGEAQRVKLAKHLGRRSLSSRLLVLDEPSTGLHPHDIDGLLTVLDRLVRAGATIVVVEHNTDVIRAADWVIDLGPGAGPAGGQVIYAGPPDELLRAPDSLTGEALREEAAIQPSAGPPPASLPSSSPGGAASPAQGTISVRGAYAHNLKGVDVDLPKGRLTVVTGVSGSGKSSLVGDVLEAEARRRFLESLSLYERQGTREGPEAPVESVTGLGVAVAIGPERRLHARRATVGSVTEIAHHLAVLLAFAGERRCPECGAGMLREGSVETGEGQWQCPACGTTAPAGQPRHFNPTNYGAACLTCNGVGSLRKPNPDKLIVHPDKPLCGGAMYSPGFFPKGYLCKPFNGGYDMVQALAARYGFDPAQTPWNEMAPEAQHAFLFGDPEPLLVTFQSRTGRTRTGSHRFPGFYGWIRDWDVGGTYTDSQACPDCQGGRLRPEYGAVTLGQHNFHDLTEMPLSALFQVLQRINVDRAELAGPSWRAALRRLRFLVQVGVGYLHLNRAASTLSAGEAQRIALAGLLGSDLTSLTVILDEPSRGLHPAEVGTLAEALLELRDGGNTVVVVEHDPVVIRAADYLVDMGPGPGAAGGQVVAQGRPEQVAEAQTVTARWLRGERRISLRPRRPPRDWMVIQGARANNLRGEEIRFPLGALVGVCGVSGSGKSTLAIDTFGRALAPKKQTTSVAYEPIDPGEHDAIRGAPSRAIVIDQAKTGIRSPAAFLDLERPLQALYANSDDAQALGLDQQQLAGRCSACGGSGSIEMDMGFLPSVHTECETCRGTGYRPEAWDVRLHGLALPEVLARTIDQVHELFGEGEKLSRSLAAARDVGLGYLVLRQPGYALSGGEAQRLKIAAELCRKTAQQTLYILDEPTVGQHLEDVSRLIDVLRRLVDGGHTVLVIEHHPHVLASCDWLVELGPGGGPEGGRVVAAGPPECVAAGSTPTAPFIREILEQTG
jgi:excinuclease ABC subunit A